MKLKAVILGVVAASTVTFGVLNARRDDMAPTVTSAVVTRGPIVSTIASTGTVEPVKTVQVGSQVSGTVESLFADFNSIVRKGQVLARLEPVDLRERDRAGTGERGQGHRRTRAGQGHG